MGKKNKNRQNQQNQMQGEPKIEKSPEMLALEQQVAVLTNKKRAIQQRRNDLEKEKRGAETELDKLANEQGQAAKEVERLKQDGFEIREAIRKIDELKLAEYTEEALQGILSLLGNQTNQQIKNSENDDVILAVAARYKLNDVRLCTEDKNLKNKAAAIGVKTV